MKRPLAVGDRVRVYGVQTVDGHFWSLMGTITRLHPPGPMVHFKCEDDDEEILVHAKQCRRIKKRERRWWTGKWMQANETDRHNRVFVPHEYPSNLDDVEMTLVEAPRKG